MTILTDARDAGIERVTISGIAASSRSSPLYARMKPKKRIT